MQLKEHGIHQLIVTGNKNLAIGLNRDLCRQVKSRRREVREKISEDKIIYKTIYSGFLKVTKINVKNWKKRYAR